MSASVEAVKESARQAEVASKWNKAIKRQRGKESKWREKARKTIDRYRDDRDAFDEKQVKFNILWANTEVMKPAIFARMPVPDVRRRYSTKDPVARTAALILERSLSYCMDSYDFKDTLDRAEEDYLIPGRGQAIVCYKPYFKQTRRAVEPLPPDDPSDESGTKKYPEGTLQDDQGAYSMDEEKLYEEVYTEYQPWDLYCFGEGKQRCKVPWEAYGSRLTKDEVQEEYPDFADFENLTYAQSKEDDEFHDIEEKGQPKALIWKVWHKASRKMIVVSAGYDVKPIEEVDDPLHLEQFFPSPEPLYSIRTNGSDIPKPEYLMYQDQALELDILVARQRWLTTALKYRGIYDKVLDSGDMQLSSLIKGDDNTFLPVGNYAQLAEKGGIEALIDTLPLEEIAQVLGYLTTRIDLLKQEIYEIYGISDIVRGASKASETLGAQQLKAQYAGMRISTRQERFQRFIRDILRIKAEIIAEHFSPQTLQIMTGIDVQPDEMVEQMRQSDQVEPNVVSQTEFMQACQLIKSDKLRGFRIDIETDSTIPVDKDSEQQNRVAFMQAVGTYLAGMLPMVENGSIPVKLAREGLLFVVRGFKVGSELEASLEELGDNADEAQQLTQMKQQSAQMQEKLAELQKENASLKSDAQVKQMGAQNDIQISQQKAGNDMSIAQKKADNDILIAQRKAESERIQRAQDAEHERTQKSFSAHQDREIKGDSATQDRAIKGSHASLDSEIKGQGASQDREIKAESVKTETQAKEGATIDKKLDRMTDGIEALVQATTQSIEAASKPKTRKGTMKGPSGAVYKFESGEQ